MSKNYLANSAYDEKWNEAKNSEGHAICQYCGDPIYSKNTALYIHANDEIIHEDCWLDYSAENVTLFASSVGGGV